MVKSLGGCTSDGVPGIQIPDDKGGWSKRGVGEGTAIKYAKGELPDHYKAYSAIISTQGRKTARRNRILTSLPFIGTPHYKVLPDHPNLEQLVDVANELEFNSILQDLDTWKKILRMRSFTKDVKQTIEKEDDDLIPF